MGFERLEIFSDWKCEKEIILGGGRLCWGFGEEMIFEFGWRGKKNVLGGKVEGLYRCGGYVEFEVYYVGFFWFGKGVEKSRMLGRWR